MQCYKQFHLLAARKFRMALHFLLKKPTSECGTNLLAQKQFFRLFFCQIHTCNTDFYSLVTFLRAVQFGALSYAFSLNNIENTSIARDFTNYHDLFKIKKQLVVYIFPQKKPIKSDIVSILFLISIHRKQIWH